MFRHGKYRLISAVSLAVILSAISLVVFGTSSATVSVKLTPVMVSSDTSTLPPDAAKAEMAAVWRLFDRDTDTVYTPTQTARITVSMPGLTSISRIRFYGASSYTLNVYLDNNGTWVPLPSLSGLSLAGLNASSWNTFATPDSFAATYLLLEFIPQGNITAGIREIELWGPEASTIQESAKRVTLDGLRTAQDALSVLSATPSHILEFSASPSEVPLSDAYPTSLSISLTQNPVLFKRAYIMYDGYNLVRPVSVFRRINNLSWSGGFVISSPDGTVPSWASYIEEINPSWLMQGVNTFDFRSPSGTAIIRNLQLIVEMDSGWNSVSSVSPSMLYDGDLTTSYAVTASSPNPLVEITFERPVQPDTIRLNLPGPLNVKAGLQYQSGTIWQDVQPGWQVDLSTMQAGWNDIPVPAAVSATGLRLILITDSLAPGTVVGSINEIRVSASPSGPMSQASRIVISYPRDGEYFGRTAYIQGFVTPAVNSSGSAASVTVEAKPGQSAASDGAITLSLTKDETRFYTQADNEEWEPVANTDYAGQPGVSQSVLLNKNSGSSGTSASGGGGVTTDNREQYTDTVSPGQAKKIQYKNVTLDIPSGAVDQDTQITIIPLTGPDLARLDPGMINVTFPDAGYRLLPHGMKFKKAIKIAFGYSKQLLAAGQVDDDVQMYFYNEKFLHWEKLSKNKVDKALSVVESNSDHFTDIINSTLVVPEHPEALSFNPNSIKDIKAADPSANVNFIEPPRASNKGTANLSYPIEVPPGRNKLQPNIAVQYNSSGGNGWMGLGWDIPLQEITIDTRWGVPRYDATNETETYTLDGEQLAPVAHRGPLVARMQGTTTLPSGEVVKILHTRVEGQFRKIIRHGSQPNNYWWEVIDKNGTKYFYGGEPSTNGPASDSVLGDDSGNVFKWALRKVQDSNGNYIKYSYAKTTDSGIGDGAGGVAGYQLYLKAVQYSGHATLNPPYTVLFKRDRDLLGEPRRPDVSIDARGGFKMVTADLLRRIEIYFGGSYDGDKVTGGAAVRSYEFKYETGAFFRQRLKSITQFGALGTLFNKHEFSYYDDVSDGSGSYNGFGTPSDWNTGSDGITGGFGIEDNASAINGSSGSDIGGHLYLGINCNGQPTKQNSLGFKIGYNSTDNDGSVQLIDINGDGLPDKVFRKDDVIYYRPNQSGPNGNTVFGEPIAIHTLNAISKEHSDTSTLGFESYPCIAAIELCTNNLVDSSDTFTTTTAYFSDVNGDGLPDLVIDGKVFFNHLDFSQNAKYGVPTFTEGDSNPTPSPIGSGAVDGNNLVENFSSIYEKRIDSFPLMDAVRRWVAPYDGVVSVSGPVKLIQDASTARSQYQTADGVQVAIQFEGGELWSPRTVTVSDFRDPKSARILADDYNDHTPTGVDNILVTKGDHIYFRVQSVFDGKYDQVSWDPQITYLSAPALKDVNNKDVYRYRASEDFVYAGRLFRIKAPFTGRIRFTGDLKKSDITTDDITLVIYKNGTELIKEIRSWNSTDPITVSVEADVAKGDDLEWRVFADSPIDLGMIVWEPQAYYTQAQGIPVVVDKNGNPLVKLNPSYDADMYPADGLTAPQQSWIAPKAGTLVVTPTLNFSAGVPVPSQVAFTVKKRVALLGKGFILVSRDDQGGLVITPAALTVNVNEGDELFFDFSSRDPNLVNYVTSSSVNVSYASDNTSFTVPSGFHSAVITNPAFPIPYRGWAYIGYNGNRDRANQPIDQSVLNVNESYTFQNARVYPFRSFPTDFHYWGGADDMCWVAGAEMSSSRLGLKYIQVPQSSDFAGRTAASRMSSASQTAIGFGISDSEGTANASGSAASGSSYSKVDFIDMNGDRYPDVVSNSRIQYTQMNGGLESTNRGVLNFDGIRESKNDSSNLGVGGNPAKSKPNGKGNNATSGTQTTSTADQGSQMPSLGFSGSLGSGTADSQYDLLDVNGDGLPDKVYKGGMVSLNLGYAFAPRENWTFGVINDGASSNQSVGADLGGAFNDGIYGYGGGVSYANNRSHTNQTFVDINGDGLLDIVTEGSDVVLLNTGAGFKPVTWKGFLGSGLNKSSGTTMGAGAYITIPIWIPLTPCFIIINPGVNANSSMSRAEVAFMDVNGDGYPDHVTSDTDGNLTVALSNIGRTNLLKTVKRPLGGKFDIEYTRTGNTYSMPQSQWVMTKSTLTDGMGNTYVNSYAYADGFQDRFEREFYGFQTVTETHAPVSANPKQNPIIERTITETFHTKEFNDDRDFYLKGLLLKSVTTDHDGHVWAKTTNTYTPTPVQDGGNALDFTSFPALTQTDTYFYDGSNKSEAVANKSTYQTFSYDSYGNITRFYDAGEVFTGADDVIANITYTADTSAYIVGKPLTIVVTDAVGRQLRSRSATYESGTGNLLTLTLNNTIGASVWTMKYYTNGNLWTITDPVGYKLIYSYDDTVTATYVTGITDNFPAPAGPYHSTAVYNPLFGQPDWTQDLNLNYQVNLYDEFGRMVAVCSPYDAPGAPVCAGVAAGTIVVNTPVDAKPTLAFVYTMPTLQGEDNQIGGTPLQLARAITYNKAVSVKGSDPIIIKTVTFTDGMKRVLQTKKDATVNGTNGMTVSGKVVFDDLGRVVQQGQPMFETGYNPNFNNYLTGKNPTLFFYDPLDRTTVVLTPDAQGSEIIGQDHYAKTTTTYGFGQVNLLSPVYATTTVIDPIGNKTGGTGTKGKKVSYKDVDDRIMAVVEFNNTVPVITTYDYDPLGQITTVLDDKKNQTTIAYDQLGRRTMIDNPDTGSTLYGYDANGNLISKLTANYQKNQAITYTYAFNRLQSINYPFSAQVKYDYGTKDETGDQLGNRAGRIKKVTDESGVEERYYGRLGETLREEKTPTGAKTSPVQNMKFTTQYVFYSFGRMTDMTYPDGEALHYTYDNGGLLKAAWGMKNSTRYDYIMTLLYDEFGQRTHIEYGNGTKTDYTYDDKTRRLATLNTGIKDGSMIQQLSYTYDLVGNVMNLHNGIGVPTNTALPAGPVDQNFRYDDLYQLQHGDGTYTFGPGKGNNYTNDFIYDTIGNMINKKQVHTIVQPNTTSAHLPKETNYVLSYTYGSPKPHAVTDDGNKLYTYDPAGNMTGWTSKSNGTRRTIMWNEENRVQEIDNNGQKTYFLYDDTGERVIKRGQHGETVYVNRFYAIRNGELGTKHIFAGETRVLSKLVKTPPTNTANTNGSKTVSTTTPVEKDQFFYHGDHLGSSNMITDAYGAVYQHLEYFPYGETWIEEGGSSSKIPGYMFTGKELDPETGLYYYGARYYDPVLSRWISADPILGKYLPSGDKDKDDNLLGEGGVFNPINLGFYAYSHHNPIIIIDPDGADAVILHGGAIGVPAGVEKLGNKVTSLVQSGKQGPIFVSIPRLLYTGIASERPSKGIEYAEEYEHKSKGDPKILAGYSVGGDAALLAGVPHGGGKWDLRVVAGAKVTPDMLDKIVKAAETSEAVIVVNLKGDKSIFTGERSYEKLNSLIKEKYGTLQKFYQKFPNVSIQPAEGAHIGGGNRESTLKAVEKGYREILNRRSEE
jgi:RHS repeat-associated protein